MDLTRFFSFLEKYWPVVVVSLIILLYIFWPKFRAGINNLLKKIWNFLSIWGAVKWYRILYLYLAFFLFVYSIGFIAYRDFFSVTTQLLILKNIWPIFAMHLMSSSMLFCMYLFYKYVKHDDRKQIIIRNLNKSFEKLEGIFTKKRIPIKPIYSRLIFPILIYVIASILLFFYIEGLFFGELKHPTIIFILIVITGSL